MANPRIDMFEELFNTIREADQDLVRDLLKIVLERLMSAEADSLCGAGYGERSQERTNRRNGYRLRPWDSRVGSIDLAIPKLRQGSYFPDWLLDIHRRSERALVSVVAEAWLRGVSHRRMEGLVNALGIEHLSRTQVSEMVKILDEEVAAFRNRPLDAGPYRHVWLDAMQVKCREAGRVVNVALVLATAVNADGRREALGMDVITSEDGAGWTAFLRGLVARGLSGVKLVTSDAHEGLKAAIAAVLPGASWQRCRTHFMRNLLTRVPKSAQNLVATLVRSTFAQPSAEETWAQLARVVAQLRKGFPEAAAMLEEAADELLAFTAFPKEHWRQIWSNNPQERQNREIRRRTDVVGIFPHRGSIVRLVGALLSEQNDEWLVARRYMSLGSLEKLAPPTTALDTTSENKELPVAV
jgi:putative transposase